MRARIAAPIALAMALGSGSAMAVGGDGNQLITQCAIAVKAGEGAPVDRYYDVGYCLGLTQGVRQTMQYQNDELPAKYRTCFPEGITNGQGVRIVLKYLQDHPAELQDHAIFLVHRAYKEAYPCR